MLTLDRLRTEIHSAQGIVVAVDGVSLTILPGETFALVGESGSGKSVTALSITRLLPDNARVAGGDVMLEETNLAELPERKMRDFRGGRISMIFQEPATSLNAVLTIGRQIVESIETHTPLRGREARAKAIDWLKRVGIPEPERRIDDYPFQLSGGQKQRVMIAMALACNPKLLIADEPTTALDVTIQAQVLDLMKRLRQRYRTSILLISHDLGVIADVADRVIVMYCGRVVETAEIDDLFDRPAHPYTEGLLNSIPSRSIGQDRLYQIPGTPPAPTDRGPGCAFYPRCPKRMPICLEKPPPLFHVSETQQAACFALPAARA